MKTKVLSLLAFLTVVVTTSFGQKLKVLEGDSKILKSEQEVNITYDYSNMAVGKIKTEEEYVTTKKEDYNKKEPGRGDKWEKSWIADREERFQPQFEELFNKHGKAKVGNYPKAKYTLIVKTTFTEPGFNVHVVRKNASIDGELWIVETTNPSNVLSKISYKKSVGRTFGGYDYDTGTRIQEAYALLGKTSAKFLSK